MADCLNCTEKCPQSELAHEIAKGRMYATNELIELVKKIEAGKLVEVVRCKDCKHRYSDSWCEYVDDDDNFYCARGERKDGDGNAKE